MGPFEPAVIFTSIIYKKKSSFKTCSPKAGLLSVLPAPNENPWFCPVGAGVPNCAPESVAVKLKPPDVPEFCGVAGAAPNVKAGAGIEAALTGKAFVLPKAKPVEAPPNADCVEFPNVGAAVLAGVPNVSGVTALPPPAPPPNVKGLTGVGAWAWGLEKHVEELNTELPNVAWVVGAFDVIGVVLLAKPNPVKGVVAGFWPKANEFWGTAGGAVGAAFKAPNCKLVLVLLVVVVLVVIPEEAAVDDEPPNWKPLFAALQLPNRDGAEFWVLEEEDDTEAALGWVLVSPWNRDGAGFWVLEEDDKTEEAIGWLLGSPPNSDGVEFWVFEEEDEAEAAIVLLLVSPPNRAGVGFWALEVETEEATEWLLVWLPNRDWLGFCVLGTDKGAEEDTSWVLVTPPNIDVLLWVAGTEQVEEAGWLNALPKMGLKVVCVGLTSAADAAIDMAGPKIGLNSDDVVIRAVLLAGCAEAVGAVGAHVVDAEDVKPKRLPPPRSVVDVEGRGWARIWAKAEGTEEGAVDTVGCAVAMEGSDFTGPKLKAVEELEEGTWAATDVAGAMNDITTTSVSLHRQWP